MTSSTTNNLSRVPHLTMYDPKREQSFRVKFSSGDNTLCQALQILLCKAENIHSKNSVTKLPQILVLGKLGLSRLQLPIESALRLISQVNTSSSWGRSPDSYLYVQAVNRGYERVAAIIEKRGTVSNCRQLRKQAQKQVAFEESFILNARAWDDFALTGANKAFKANNYFYNELNSVTSGYGRLQTIPFLLDYGVSPNGIYERPERLSAKCRRDLWTVRTWPAEFAIEKGNTALLSLLLQRGASPEGCPEHPSLLEQAMAHSNVQVREQSVALLIQFGANVNRQISKGISPVATAVNLGSASLLRQLLKAGANPIEQISDENEKDVLEVLAESGKLEMVKVFIEEGYPLGDDPRTWHCLELASRKHQKEVVSYLLELGKTRNITLSKKGKAQDPVLSAIRYGQLEKLKTLLSQGKKVPLDKPIWYAVQHDHPAIVEYLFTVGNLNSSSTGSKGQTLLHHAARHNSPECARFLIVNDAYRYAKDNDGRTPFAVAAKYGSREAAEAILGNRSAHRNAMIRDIVESSQLPSLRFLVTLNRSYALSALCSAVRNNKRRSTKTLLESGRVEVNSQNKEGRSALHLAAEHKAFVAAGVLLDHKANTNLKNERGLTPTHLAAQANDLKLFELLVSAGADLRLTDKQNLTPLQYLTGSHRDEVAMLLLRHKKKVGFVEPHQAYNGNLMLKHAIQTDDSRFYDLLCAAGVRPDYKELKKYAKKIKAKEMLQHIKQDEKRTY